MVPLASGMPSHMHLVFRSLEEKPEDLIRGFKSVTARKLIKLIGENPIKWHEIAGVYLKVTLFSSTSLEKSASRLIIPAIMRGLKAANDIEIIASTILMVEMTWSFWECELVSLTIPSRYFFAK